MKKIIFISIVAVTAIVFACNKNAPDITANLSPLQPQNVDLNAGSWKTILLPRPDTFAVAAPNPVSSADYKAELNEIKGYQKNLTSSQMATIQYWAAGGVLRWNELMRGLVTKYNLPAYQNPDNSYPIPNASPAAISLRVAAPAIIMDNSCSFAFCSILAISVGNNNFIISAVTPAITAASDG